MTDHSRVSYSLNGNADFTVSEYNAARPFASFFPGVAGRDGIPMWTFYVNRGQCICSMGIGDKEHAIMEFFPANMAYQLAATVGFRTFVNFPDKKQRFYEPFQNYLHDKDIERTQQMHVSMAGLHLEERNKTLGLSFHVAYCNVPNDEYPGLIRKLQIRNDGPVPVTVECLDGLPVIVPYGIDNSALKFTRRLVEAFVEVTNLAADAPMFRSKVEPVDRPEVVRIRAGNFYLGFCPEGEKSRLVRPVVDPARVFGSQAGYSYPERFLREGLAAMLEDQVTENRFPSAMGTFRATLEPGASHTYISIIGHAASDEALNATVPRLADPDYVRRKFAENDALMGSLLQGGFICSREPGFDQYARQNYLDNGLRGGFPITLGNSGAATAFYMFSRKHGDLERDYNHFSLPPSKYSQGNANYRDVNQNRRNDLFFNPDVGTDNIALFYNLVQLDGFNPLVIKEVSFAPGDPAKLDRLIGEWLGKPALEEARSFLQKTFTPGSLLAWLQEKGLTAGLDFPNFLGCLLGICDRLTATEHGEGFWTDHWTYNLDLLENYLALFPENGPALLFDTRTFTFFDNAHRVQPRDDKYVLRDGRPMQLNAVVLDREKNEMILGRREKPSLVRTAYGTGSIYRTTLFCKMLCLVVNKLASLDPEGVGVEMEADKPNWYDALNGLPGLFGSSISEAFEIKRNVLFLEKMLAGPGMESRQFALFEELATFLNTLQELLDKDLSPNDFWNESNDAKENYRAAARLGISGKETMVPAGRIRDFLAAGLKKLDLGISRALDSQGGIPATYFINEVTDYTVLDHENGTTRKNSEGMVCFRAKAFRQSPLPLFLEGAVHYLRTLPGKSQAAELAERVRQSGLYDEKLKMYKVNASLNEQPMEIGRARVFAPGWFENESIWLHMEYKYMLELLRNELFEDFYRDFKNVFVPFFNPETYGRSILENSSFIVSSANPDKSLHGSGFVARLSGATAEFISILLLMTAGRSPFHVNAAGKLQLKFKPALPSWLFTAEDRTERLYRNDSWHDVAFVKNSFSFMFLGDILVTYLNPKRQNTFGKGAVTPQAWTLFDHAGKAQHITGNTLTGGWAEKVRRREVGKIEVELG